MIRLLIAGALTVGCHRSVDTDQGRSSIAQQTSIAPPIAKSAANSVPVLWRAKQACLESIAPDRPTHERLTRVLTQCLGGLRAEEPFSWSIDGENPRVVAEHRLSTPACIRFAVAIEPSLSQIHADLLDENDDILASSTDRNVLLLPSTGVLCLPGHTQVRLRVATPEPPVGGLGSAAFGH